MPRKNVSLSIKSLTDLIWKIAIARLQYYHPYFHSTSLLASRVYKVLCLSGNIETFQEVE